MISASVSELRSNLSEYLQRVRDGGERISRHWQGDADAVEAIREQRREL